MRNAGLEEAQAGIKIAGRNINNLRYADDTTLMEESEEELKSLLMKVKVESEKVGLKLNIQKMKIMASRLFMKTFVVVVFFFFLEVEICCCIWHMVWLFLRVFQTHDVSHILRFLWDGCKEKSAFVTMQEIVLVNTLESDNPLLFPK